MIPIDTIHERRILLNSTKDKISLWELFTIFLNINTFTFGGGFTIVPIIRDEFVNHRKVIDDNEMLDIMALAQSGPGAMAISASLLTGYRLRGPLGALTCVFASILPCLVIIFTISHFYQAFRENFYINAMLLGISGIISAVLFVTVYNMGRAALEVHPVFSVGMMVLAFVLGFFTNINTGLIILLLGLIGIVVFTWEDKQ